MTASPSYKDGATSPLTKANDHEAKMKDGNTLPNGRRILENITVTLPQNRSVMWAVPALAGSRSESPPPQEGTAGDVTRGGLAEQGSSRGAAVAVHDEAQQATPAMTACVIDGNVAEDNVSGTDVDEANVDGAHARVVGFENEAKVNDAASSMAAKYAVIKEARALMRDIDETRARRRDSTPVDGTTEDYTGKMKDLRRITKDLPLVGGIHPLCVAIAGYATKANSFYGMRSAAKAWARKKIAELLAAQDRLQRADRNSGAWGNCVDDLGAATQLLRWLSELDIERARKITGSITKPVESKRLVLGRADDDWRDRYLEATSKSLKYRHASVLLGLCGMRPAELEKGVLVRTRGAMVAVKIKGAKVRETSGQPWRGLFIPKDRFPAWFLEGLGDEPKVFAAPRDAMRSYLYRLSKKVFPVSGSKKPLILSAYVLRHAVATDLRQAEWTDVEIASVLGELRAETTRWYGLRWRGSKSRRSPDVAIVRGTVATARVVIDRDRAFIAKKRLATLASKGRIL